MIWRYKLSSEFVLKHKAFEGIVFENEWTRIRDGWIWIADQYAWDGCSPSYPILKTGLWTGVWDGPLGQDCRPVSWKASLCHDVLCQFRGSLKDMTKDQSVEIFKQLLILNHAPKWMVELYPAAVWHFGPQAWCGDLGRYFNKA